MMKRILSTIFVLVILLLTSGCQTKTSPLEENKNPEPVAKSSLEQASSTPSLDESAIIAILASKNKQDPTQYELHDIKINGNYAVGRWSFNGSLSQEMFWVTKENFVWSLVYVGRDMPRCDQLASWPTSIKAGCRDDLNGKQISNFSQCVTAGGRVENTKPRRCLDGQGNIFVEMLPSTVDKRYISQDLNKCVDLDFDCNIQEKRFMDGQGCGCQSSTEVIKNICSPADKAGDVCAQLYTATCGWFNQAIKCLRYPCAQNFGNPCEACHNQQVEYWTAGECPK